MGEKSTYAELEQRIIELENEVAKRKQEEEALQEIKDKYRALFDRTIDCVFLNDLEGNFIDANPAALNLLGYTKEEISSLSYASILKPADSLRAFKAIEDLVNIGPMNELMELEVNHKDGTRIFVDLLASLIYRKNKPYAVLVTARVITKRKLAEQAFQESDEKFRSLVDLMSDWLWEVDKNGIFTYVDPKVKDFLGHTAEELIGKPLNFLMPEADKKKCYSFFQEQSKQRKPFMMFKNTNLHKDGHDRKTETNGMPVFNSEGNLVGWRGVNRDITERVQAEEALQASEERFRSLVENAPGFIFIIDRDGTIQFANRTQPQYTVEDVIGTNIFDYEIDENMTFVKKAIEHIFETGESSWHSGPGIGANGHISWYDIQMGPIMHKGEIVAVMQILTDITERKQAEDKLRTEHDKFQGVLNVIGEGLYIVNRDFDIEYQNKVLENAFDNKLNTKCYATYFRSDEPCKFCPVIETVVSGEIKQVEAELSSGKFYDVNASPFTDVNGEVKAIVLLRNITEKKILQAEAMRAGHLASLGELSAGVAHEINNPINGVINYAEILQDEFEEKGEDADIPKRIIKEGERIATIVRNLLSFARDHKENRSHEYIGEMLSDTLSLVGKQIIKDGIELVMDIPHDLPAVNVRTQEIQQVFLNLMSNARHALNQKYSRKHKDKILKIKGESIEIDGLQIIRMTFYDKGIGIPTELLDKICNPFFSTKPKGEGTGLGLSISHGIIKNHGGRLLFETVEGEYTSAIIELPEAR